MMEFLQIAIGEIKRKMKKNKIASYGSRFDEEMSKIGGVWRGAKGKENSESNKGEGKSICKSQCFSGFENGEEGLEV